MKLTVNVNIAGCPYTVDEDAYSLLNSYLADISDRISPNDDNSEMLADIESRVVEILKENGIDSNRVVSLSEVNMVIDKIGSPEIFGEKIRNKSYNYDSKPLNKKLMRDLSQKMLGGVCSGIAAYVSIDVVWIRLAFLLLVFAGGLSIPLYLMAWIIIPAARNDKDLELLERMKEEELMF